LRCFVAAAQHLSFRRAAAEVALTPAAFSQRIKQLEELVGCTLLERSPQQVTLTREGQALLGRAQAALEHLRACRDVASEADPRVRFSIGTRFELGLSWLVPFITELRTSRPGWTVDLVFGSGQEILQRLDAGLLDAVVTSAPTANAGWSAQMLHPEAYAFVAAASRVAEQPLAEVADAGGHVLIDIDDQLPLSRYLMAVCPGLQFADVWRVGTGAAVLALVEAGHGVAVLPRYMIAEPLAQGRLVELLPEYELLSDTFRLLFRATSPLAEVLTEFADLLRAHPLR
jgi:DNA-binding transcriptional LysR family regulator